MKEFSNRLFVCPVEDITVAIEDPFDDFDKWHSDVDIMPTVYEQEKEGNKFYRFELRSAFSDVPAADIEKYRNNKPCILIVFDTDGNWYQVGSYFYKVRAVVNTLKFVNEIIFSADLLEDPFAL